MTLRTNNAEGGTSGTAVSTANSGGTSGTAWGLVNAAGGGTITYDGTHAHEGSLAYKISPAAGGSCEVRWNDFNSSAFAASWYCYFTGIDTDNWEFLRLWASGSRALAGYIDGSGIPRLNDSANSGLINGVQPALTANTLYRFEVYCVPSASGTLKFAYYLGDSTTPVSEFTSTTANLGTSNITDLRLGKASATGTGTNPFWLDAIQADDDATDYIGPWSTPGTPPADTVHVSAVTSNLGLWVPVGSPNIVGAVADHTDLSKYAETPGTPNNAAQVLRLDPLTAAPESVKVWASAAVASTVAVDLLQGSTVITSVAATPLTTEPVAYQLTLDATAQAAVTDPETLDVQITGDQA